MSFTAKSTLSSIPYKPIEGPHMRITWEEEEDAEKYEYSYLSALPKASGSSLLHERMMIPLEETERDQSKLSLAN